MPNIKPISDLRNYGKVLSEVREDSPVYLTKNGRGAYAIMEISEYEELEKAKAYAWMMSELNNAEKSIAEGKTVSDDEIRQYFEEKHRKVEI